MTDDALRHAALGFEAVKVSMSQDKNGIILRLNIHPNDCPQELHTDWVGTRYMVGMVRLNDDDTPDDRGFAAHKKLVASAGLLCRNADFFTFMVTAGHIDKVWASAAHDPVDMEEACADAMRDYCEITSRADLLKNEEARKKFETLRQSFKNWKEGKDWKT